MKSIQCQSLLSPLPSKHKYTQQNKPIWLLPNKHVAVQGNGNGNGNRVSLIRTRAIPSPFLLVASSPTADAGNISSLVKASAGLLFAYWIANFVVPEFVLKDLLHDKTNENEENQSKDEPGNKPM